MIISASYKTDIPAFHGKWLIERFSEGFCNVMNPYNKRCFTVDLSRNSVDGIVFWTRNPEPFLDGFSWIRTRHYPFYIQFTITGYPRLFEPLVPPVSIAISLFRGLSKNYGREALVWRYDPLLFTSLTGEGFHIMEFGKIAESLKGCCNEVVISFATIYRKTRRRMDDLGKKAGFEWWDPGEQEKIRIAATLADIASENGMKLSLCGQRHLISPGVSDASCIDPFRLCRLA
ncbi:MAG: DUF1848 family protein, partial [Synergistales bacterium]|nr:DUF1848 family protein [Synergistales bacterium]